MLGESVSAGGSCPSDEPDSVDPAIADALQSLKNRATGRSTTFFTPSTRRDDYSPQCFISDIQTKTSNLLLFLQFSGLRKMFLAFSRAARMPTISHSLCRGTRCVRFSDSVLRCMSSSQERKKFQ